MFKYQMKRMFESKRMLILLLTELVISLIYFIWICFSNTEGYDGNSLYIGNAYTPFWLVFSVIYPFIVAVPFSTVYLSDHEQKSDGMVIVRCGRKNYLFSMLQASFAGNFLWIFSLFGFNLLLSNIFLPVTDNTPMGPRSSANFIRTLYGTNHLFTCKYPQTPLLKIYIMSPLLYNLIYLLLLSTVTGIFGVFLMCVSFWCKRYKVLLFLPLFLMIRAGNILTSSSYTRAMHTEGYNLTNWSLMDYLAPFSFDGKCYPLFCIFLIVILGFSAFSIYRWLNYEWN